MRLEATITPEMCPYLDKTIKVRNKRIIKITGGTITFYTVPNMVVMVKKALPPADWSSLNRSTYETSVFEIRTRTTEVVEE
jgi:hypothetical protein